MRGLWARRRPTPELLELVQRRATAGPAARRRARARRHRGERTVGELARELGLSLPAASKLTTELETHSLVQRREDADDRRRTVVDLNRATEDGCASGSPGAAFHWSTRLPD